MAILTAATPIGYELPPVSRRYLLEHFMGKSGAKSIHNDMDAARREGLPAPVAVGPQIAALIFRQLRAAFDRGWIEGGRCELTFRRPVYLPSFCVARGRVTGREALGDKLRLSCEVWIENDKGEKVIVGTASGLVPAGE